MREERLVSIGNTRLHVVELGHGYPVLVLHGGPGCDHRMFGDYLDELANEFRLVLVDQRSHGRSDPAPEETWTLRHHARDVTSLASALGFERYAVLGHSYGAFVALQHAVDFPGRAGQTIVSSGLPASRFLDAVAENLERFEPRKLREQVASSWEREKTVRTQEEFAALLHDQLPFQFADPLDPRIEAYERRTAGFVLAPDILRRAANADYGGIDVEDRLGEITQPVLVLAGRHDRTCTLAGSELMAERIPNAELVVLDGSGHMTFVEEPDRYVAAVRDFLRRHAR
jgi:pimeloyl-ACP methyl ester carboxylesterase